jgi:hypothetical protein
MQDMRQLRIIMFVPSNSSTEESTSNSGPDASIT